MSRPDLLGEVFLGAFLIGLLSTLGLLALGAGHHGHGGHGHGHGGHGHGHGGHAHGAHAHGHGHAAQGGGALDTLWGSLASLLSLSSLLGLLLGGGAAGYVARRTGAGDLSSIALAAVFGLVGAWLIALATRLIGRAEAGVIATVDLVGTVARVIAPVGGRRTGEIAWSHQGARKALPARGEDEAARLIERDEEVIVMRVERGVAYVRRSSDLLGAPSDSSPSSTNPDK